MKLSHLSLAIFSAIALAACGGSSSNGDHTMPDQGQNPDQNQGGNTNQDQNNDQDQNVDQEEALDADIVDPTKDKVVDAILLAKTPTTASQQYIRGASSIHDRIVNPSNATPASATALSGITLDVQNPNLTNIVIGRIEGKNNKGEDVKVAQFAGSLNSNMPSDGGNGDALQIINRPNALVDQTWGYYNGAGLLPYYGWQTTRGYVSYDDSVILNNPLFLNQPLATTQGVISSASALAQAYTDYVKAFDDYQEAVKNATVSSTEKAALEQAVQDFETAKSDYDSKYANLKANAPNLANAALKLQGGTKALPVISDKADLTGTSKAKNGQAYTSGDFTDVNIELAFNPKYFARYGYGAYIFANGNKYNVWGDGGWGDTVDNATGVVSGHIADSTVPAGWATNGLVGIYNNGNHVIVRGDEDNNVRTSRIFGHYYLDPGLNGNVLYGETSNSWQRPATFITGFDAAGKPNEYGFGAVPMILDHVQYGRVTATIDDFQIGNQAATNGWLKVRQQETNRDPEKTGDADDFYFYRGTGATSIEQMAALPTDTKIKYQGHALMYGIDNKFHGAGLELPNAFGNTNSYGLGNFVEATLDMGNKTFVGSVFNSWHSPEQRTGQNDTLVNFSGDVTGNTVIGKASRAYVKDDREGDLRASFFGAKAEEVGGAINSVVRQDPFGPIGWGGVFGAHRVGSGGNAWLVSSEEK